MRSGSWPSNEIRPMLHMADSFIKQFMEGCTIRSEVCTALMFMMPVDLLKNADASGIAA